MKTKHILLPTDFSKNAYHAITYALHLFEKENCTFHILNAFHVSPSGLSSTINKAKDTRLYRAIKEEAKRGIKELLEDLNAKNENPLHKFEAHSVSDSLLHAIGKTVIDYNISYIFMGTKGSSAVKEVFMGSSTVNVMKHLDSCPLVAIPEDYAVKKPREIVFATNFEHIYSKYELNPLVDLARLCEAVITILHVDTGKELSPQQKKSKEVLQERLDGVTHRFEEVKGTSKVSKALTQYAEGNENIGMIAMVNYWHSFFEKLTSENVVKKVTFHTEIPFLILPLIE